MDVVDDIGHRATGTRNDMKDVPAQPVVIRKVTVLQERLPR
jgi:hypothetical protein